MKIFILALFSLIFIVNSENARQPQTVLEIFYPFYQNIYYYGPQGNVDTSENIPLEHHNILEYRPINITNITTSGYGEDDIYTQRVQMLLPDNSSFDPTDPEYQFYGDDLNFQYPLIGNLGLGLDKRTDTATSYLSPITPELLEPVGTRPYQPYNNDNNNQNLNLYNYLHSPKYD